MPEVTDEDRKYEGSWHLDRKVPIAMILTIVMQTGAFVWFAARLDQRVEDLAAFETDGLGPAAELRGGDARELVAQLHRRQVHGAGHGAGEAAAVVAGGHAPGVTGHEHRVG